ncbi:Zn(II)2Cys6 transcription factor domain-containing protein [Aspergillus undulatus]|uniref:Zn(II)2Cys6 transcription factor domain-containing protein n=1 Tax=Aspergillus undulatus TaxID=1810928 RepID=UPI003CCD734A
MSPSESGPITLRRACQACHRGKRRCDQRWPRCSRCRKLRLDCEYANQPLTAAWSFQDAGCFCSRHRATPPSRDHQGLRAEHHLVLVMGISSLPLSFSESMKTHFIHPELWSHTSVPQPICDILPVCQLYTDSANSSFLVPLLRQQIVHHHKLIHKSVNFEDLLASAQALLLAHCMLVATEDPSTPYSESTSAALLALGEKLYQQAPIQLPHTLSPRRAWLFAENVRRTIIVGFMLRSIYSLKTRNYSVRTPFVDSLPFDIRTGLWDASARGDAWFDAAGEQCDQTDSIVSLHQYSGMLESGRVHGISPFGELILAACRGKAFNQVPYPAMAG